jgi:hemerythrin-like domain-containing protein/CBS domain-containing protein
MVPISTLRQEHRLIEEVLTGLEGVARHLEGGGTVPPALVEGAIDFFGAFVDRSHHSKEEEGLMPALAAHGLPLEDGPLALLRAEHREARTRLRGLRAALVESAPGRRLAALLRDYVGFLRAHLAREDEALFPHAERVLDAADSERAAAAFAAIDAREASPAARSALLDLARALAEACRCQGEGTGKAGGLVAADIMRRNLPRVSPEQSLATAAELMEWLGVRELPVVEGGRLVGILTRRDLEPHRGQYEWTAVRTAMTPDPETVEPHASVATVAGLLLARCFNAVPVVAGGTLLGMIARSDLLRLLAGGG